MNVSDSSDEFFSTPPQNFDLGFDLVEEVVDSGDAELLELCEDVDLADFADEVSQDQELLKVVEMTEAQMIEEEKGWQEKFRDRKKVRFEIDEEAQDKEGSAPATQTKKSVPKWRPPARKQTQSEINAEAKAKLGWKPAPPPRQMEKSMEKLVQKSGAPAETETTNKSTPAAESVSEGRFKKVSKDQMEKTAMATVAEKTREQTKWGVNVFKGKNCKPFSSIAIHNN